MKYFVFSTILFFISAAGLFAEDFRNLKWGMSQEEVMSLNGPPQKISENKLVYGTLTQTLTYNEIESDSTYDLLFIENHLTNASYKIAAKKKSPAEDVHKKYRAETILLEETFEEPPVVEKMDNSTKKYVYENERTKVMIIYYNTPIKADYINRSAYLNVNYSNNDPVMKAKIKNLKIDRARGM